MKFKEKSKDKIMVICFISFLISVVLGGIGICFSYKDYSWDSRFFQIIMWIVAVLLLIYVFIHNSKKVGRYLLISSMVGLAALEIWGIVSRIRYMMYGVSQTDIVCLFNNIMGIAVVGVVFWGEIRGFSKIVVPVILLMLKCILYVSANLWWIQYIEVLTEIDRELFYLWCEQVVYQISEISIYIGLTFLVQKFTKKSKMNDLENKLLQLKEQYEHKQLTEAEYNQERNKILSKL